MSKRALAITAALCTGLALFCIALFDRRLLEAIHASALASAAFFVDGTHVLDTISGRRALSSHTLSGLLLCSILIALGILGWLFKRRAYLPRAMIFTGGVQLATMAGAWLLKGWFGRMRPLDALAHGDWSHVWFVGGNSFPSGHNAFFWGLFLPLMYLFPRYRIVLLIVPVFIALARVDASMHFASDVFASIALAAFVTLLAAMLCSRWIKPTAR